MYLQARAEMTNTAKLFFNATYVHQYSELLNLCSAEDREQFRDRKKHRQESFHEHLLQMRKIAFLWKNRCAVCIPWMA